MESKQVFSKEIIVASYFELKLFGSSVSLLPFGHSRYYPLDFNLESKQITSGEVNFFNETILKNIDLNKFIAADLCDAEVNPEKESVIILNALDNCFGHALLKLFYCIQYIEVNRNATDFLIIIPEAIKHFLKPEKGISILNVKLSFSKLQECYVLNREIEKAISGYKYAYIDGTETYESMDYNLLKNKLKLVDERENYSFRNKIIFYYRADYFRMWDGKSQKKNIINLFKFLKPFFLDSVEFIIVGDKDNSEFPDWIQDKRVKLFSDKVDFDYNNLFNSALICIGLTGSHMLFPSILADCTVHLHPVFKYKNMGEDIVVDKSANEMMSSYKHLYYFGNSNCGDLTPKKLARLILIHFQGLIEKEYKMGKFLNSQKAWILEAYPQFKYALANEFRATENAAGEKKILIRKRIESLF